ncbi:hypothetical protein K8R42_05260 [bacterium]|nr:hypothetical protein [bacterium]
MISFSRQQHIFGQIIITIVILANIQWIHSGVLGVAFGLLYLWFNSKKIAEILYPKTHRGLKNVLGLLSILAYISLVYTLAYHIYQINFWIFLFIFLSIPLIIEILSRYFNVKHYFLSNVQFVSPNLKNIRKSFLPLAVFILDIILFIALFKKASLGIIRSPWELLNYKFWALFIISNLILVASIIDKKSAKNILLISWHFLLLSSIGIILYPLGFGYDSFIHQAAIKTIADNGTIQPRLFLYIGQYGQTFFLHHLSQISLATINKLLLPLFFSLIWPAGLFYGLRYGLNWSSKISYLSVLWSLSIGFSFAIMTTPQSMAYLIFALFIFILPEINKKQITIYFAWLISVMAMTIHPLAGIPCLLFSCLLAIWRLKKHKMIRMVLHYSAVIISLVSLPLLFAIYQKVNHIHWSQIFNFNLNRLINLPAFHWSQSYTFPIDMLHNLGGNQIWLYLLITLIGLYFVYKENKFIFFKRLLIFIAILTANYILINIFLSFNLQINYQRYDYVNRVAYLIGLALLPIFLTSVYFWFQSALKEKHLGQKIIIALITTIVITISTYFSYPIYDKYGNNKSFNVTATDLKTVEIIEEDAAGQPYIVLANQMIGVAAINKYGFNHYYNDNFYYSMPLGTNNIYQNYLSMVEIQASREEALVAMDKAGVNKLYFVINNYWHSAKQAMGQAEQSANDKILIDKGVNIVFIYNR